MLSKIFWRGAAACAVLCFASAAAGAQGAGRVSGFAEVNGTRLRYEVMGEGPAVVLIHGGLVDSRLWGGQMGPLSKRFRVVRYDLRGFGQSAEAPEPFSHLEDLRGLLDFLKIGRASLVGLSLGGVVAADFALEHPERVESLVLVGAGLRGDRQPPPADAAKAWEARNRGPEAFADASMTRALYKGVRPGTPAYALLRRMLLDNFESITTLRPGFLKYPERPTAERLAEIKAPTLVVIGERDAPNLKNISDALAAGIRGARKVVIRGSSHHPPVERPKELNRVLLDFLKHR